MTKRGPSAQEVVAYREAGDVAALVVALGDTRRRDIRAAVVQALVRVEAGPTLLDMLADEQLQRSAGAALVELGEESFPAIAAQLESDDERRRKGALHTVYLYARYRDMPAAQELLQAVAAGSGAPDLAEPASLMAAKVETIKPARNEEIDRHLERIRASIERDQIDGGSTVMRMYSTVHSGRMESLKCIMGLRYAAARHVIAVSPDVGEPAVGALLGLGIEELRGGVVPLIAEGLHTGDHRRRNYMLLTLICLRRARVPGAAEALERDGVTVTESMDRRAAHIYKKWVRDR